MKKKFQLHRIKEMLSEPCNTIFHFSDWQNWKSLMEILCWHGFLYIVVEIQTGATFSRSHLAISIKMLTNIYLDSVKHYQESNLMYLLKKAYTHIHRHSDARHSLIYMGMWELTTP